jgi:hypothetical protein
MSRGDASAYVRSLCLHYAMRVAAGEEEAVANDLVKWLGEAPEKVGAARMWAMATTGPRVAADMMHRFADPSGAPTPVGLWTPVDPGGDPDMTTLLQMIVAILNGDDDMAKALAQAHASVGQGEAVCGLITASLALIGGLILSCPELLMEQSHVLN